MSKSKPLLLLAFIVSIAGCTSSGGGGGAGGGGVCSEYPGASNAMHVIQFKPDSSIFQSRDEISVILGIKNSGGLPAKNIEYELIGLNPAEWIISPGEKIGGPPLLQQPDPASKTGGDEDTAEWIIKHSVSRGVALPYKIEGRATFDYETASETNIQVATREYVKRLPENQRSGFESGLGVSTSIVSDGPLKVSVQGTGKVINPGNSLPISVTIIIKNEGGGSIFNRANGRPNEIQSVTILSGTTPIQCGPGVISGVTSRLDSSGSKTYNCKLPVSASSNIDWSNVPLTVRLGYSYYVNKCISVTVNPPI